MIHEIPTWLQAIVANPDDPSLRLIFADWLEERGDERALAVRESTSAMQVLALFLLPTLAPGFIATVQTMASAFQPAVAGLVGAVAGIIDGNRAEV